MKESITYEKEISLRDLFFYILYRWRILLAAVLIGTLLFGGYAYLGNQRRMERKMKDAAQAAAEYSEESDPLILDDADFSNQIFQKLVENNRTYYEQSVLMKVDPFHVWNATAVYAVVMEKEEAEEAPALQNRAVCIAEAYPSLILNEPASEELKEIFGVDDPAYIREAVTACNLSKAGISDGSAVGYGVNSFMVSVIGLNEEMAGKGLAYIENEIEAASKGDIQQLGKHRIVELSRSVNQAAVPEVRIRQENVAKDIATYLTSISKNGQSSDVQSALEESPGRKSLKKYGIVGFLLGLFVSVAICTAVYLLSDKLRDGNILKRCFRLPVLGELNHSRARRPGKGIDRLIEKWEFRKSVTDRETLYDNISTMIRTQGEGSRILLTGTIPEDHMKEVSDSLKERLGDSYTLITEGSFLTNNRALAEAGKAATVVLIEEKHVSGMTEIRRMLETLSFSRTTVTGVVIV